MNKSEGQEKNKNESRKINGPKRVEGSAIVQLEAVIKRKTKTHPKKTNTKSTYTKVLIYVCTSHRLLQP